MCIVLGSLSEFVKSPQEGDNTLQPWALSASSLPRCVLSLLQTQRRVDTKYCSLQPATYVPGITILSSRIGIR